MVEYDIRVADFLSYLSLHRFACAKHTDLCQCNSWDTRLYMIYVSLSYLADTSRCVSHARRTMIRIVKRPKWKWNIMLVHFLSLCHPLANAKSHNGFLNRKACASLLLWRVRKNRKNSKFTMPLKLSLSRRIENIPSRCTSMKKKRKMKNMWRWW